MSNREDNSSLSGYYSMEKFIKELKKVSGIPENESSPLEDLNMMNTNAYNSIPLNQSAQLNINNNNQDFINYINQGDIRQNQQQLKGINSFKQLNPLPNNPNNFGEYNVNELMKIEMTNLRKENAELKYCLNNINKKFENELKEIRAKNELKDQELKEAKEIMKKNVALIELLGEKINNYEKQLNELNTQNDNNNNNNNNKSNTKKNNNISLNNAKYLKLIENNKKLKEELNNKEKIINNIKEELDTKNEVFDEINTMKNEMENYLQTMDKLYKEIQSRDNVIAQLKKNIQIVQNNFQQELSQMKLNIEQQQKGPNNNSLNVNGPPSEINNNKKLLMELKLSKEKELKLSNELLEVQNNYNEMKINNEKMQSLLKETDTMIQTAEDSKNNLKNEYESAIKDLIEKYEKQIQFMKLVIVKQNEELESKLNAINDNDNDNQKGEGDLNENDNEAKEGDEMDQKEKLQFITLLKNNKELVEQNEELKNMNEMMITKLKELPNLEKKFTDLFETVKLLKEENELLKQASHYSSLLKMEENKMKGLTSPNLEDNENENQIQNTEPIKPKSKNLLLDDDDNEDDNNNNNENLIYQTNPNIIDKNKLKERNKNNILNPKQEKNETNNLVQPAITQKEIIFNEDNNTNDNNNNINNNNNNPPLKVYNKKKLSSPISPKSNLSKNNITDNNNNNIASGSKSNQSSSKKADEKNPLHTETNNEDNENENNQINENFNLYKPTKDGLLTFNLSTKNYYTVEPEKYEEFWNSFDPETSIQYNTLEGLFIINSVKDNQLYYYSSKKNTMSELFKFKENHSYGCLFLDNLSKNIFAVGGKESRLVEKFSFENGTMEQLPSLSTHRTKMSCCQIDTRIYCLFGICEERPKESLIEYLDLEKLEQKWVEVQFDNQTSFNILTGMSCVTLNDNELLIIGGLINDEIPNEKLLYYSTEQNELSELDKDLPDSEDKHYLFTKNNLFNLFLNGSLVSFANIDDNNQVHILDNELKYDLYLTPKM